MDPTVTLRPESQEDRPFLRRLYGSTRDEELAQVPWSDDEKERFLDFQFQAQHTFYREQFPDATFDVVELDGEPAGRLYVDRRESEIRLIDIALLPEHRRRGVGGRLMRRVLEEGRAAGLPVQIHVERNNPAMGLYHRLGFRRIEDQGVYFLMRRDPDGAGAARSEPDGVDGP